MTDKTNSYLILGDANSPGILNWITYTGAGKLKLRGKADNKHDYDYAANIVLAETDALKAIETIKGFYEATAEKAAEYPFSLEDEKCYKPFTKTEDGSYEFTSKTKVWFRAKDGSEVKKRIKVVDGQNHVLNGFDKRIANGSEGVIAVRMFAWNNNKHNGKFLPATEKNSYGVSLGFDMLQLTKFIEFADKSPFNASKKDDTFVGGSILDAKDQQGSGDQNRLPTE